MIFCGQCGYQLATGTTLCPRCGAKIEEANGPATELHSDDATVATHSLNLRNPPGQSQVSPPQPLVLRPGANDYNTQMAYDATSRIEAPNYGTQMPQNPPATYGSNYPAQGTYQDFATGYPMNTQGGYQQQSYTQEQPDSSKVRITALVLILLGVLFLFIAVILFVLQRTNAFA